MITPFKIASGIQLSTSNTLLYTATGNVNIGAFAVANTSLSAATCSFHLVNSASSTSASNRIIDSFNVPTLQTKRIGAIEGQVMVQGDKLYGVASTAGALSIYVTGYLKT